MTNSELGSISLDLHPPQMTIRAARLTDLSQLTDVLMRSFYDSSGWSRLLYPALRLGIQEDLKQRLNAHKPYYACLSVVQPRPDHTLSRPSGNTVVGTVELSYRQPWPWQPMKLQYLYLSNLAVQPESRRQGVAYRLIQACEQIALRWGIPDLYLHVMEDNFQALRLYHKAGFGLLQTEESLMTWLGLQPRRLLMYKSLAQAPSYSNRQGG